MLGIGLQLKSTALLVFFLWLEKIVNNSIVNHLEKWPFSDFQYGFMSSQSDLLTVASDRIARAFNQSGVTRAITIYIQGY